MSWGPRGALTPALVVALGLALAAPAVAAPRGPGHAARTVDRTPRGSVLLDQPSRGPAALHELGDDLAAAARRSGLSTDRLRQVLRTDSTAWVDRHGHLYYVDGHPGAPAAAAPPEPAALPYDQTFALHSRPGADVTIYLDFVGGDVSHTVWGNGALATVPAWSLDADPAFSTTEMDTVQEVWGRVASAYAPFDVDVTTTPPSHDALFRASTDDPTYGAVAMISSDRATADGVCGTSCGGMAYLGVLDNTDDTTSGAFPYYAPAMVIGANLYQDPAYMALATEHELGHNLGLSHDGRGNEYDAGAGGWGPVMGAPYDMPLVQFSDGDYPGGTNTEDDFDVAAHSGAFLVDDDLPDVAAAAIPMGVAGSTATESGLITTREDRDTVAFVTTCTGTVTLDLTPTGAAPTLDAQLRLLTPGGSELASNDPAMSSTPPTASGLDAHLALSLAPGAYVAEVDGVGASTPTTSYSDYGSRGPWSLSVGGCVASAPPVAPGSPSGIRLAWDAPHRSATITWKPPVHDGGSAVTGYAVSVGGGAPVTVGPATRSRTFTGLTGATPYSFAVAATNGIGAGAVGHVGGTSPAMPYSAPRQVAVTQPATASDGWLDVSWTPPAQLNGNPTPFQYDVNVSGPFDGGAVSQVFPVYAATTTSIYGLHDGAGYSLSVTAVDDTTGPGDGSAPLAFTYHRIKPPTPTGLTVTVVNGDDRVSWTTVAGAAGYRVSRDGQNLFGQGPATTQVPADKHSFTWSALRPGSTYHFSVVATDSQGRASDPATTTFSHPVISAPTAVTQQPLAGGKARVTFQRPSYDWLLDHYEIRVTDAVGATRTVTAEEPPVTVGSLVAGATYGIDVRGVDGNGFAGDWSAPLSFTYRPPARPGAPTIGRATRGPRGGRTTATVAWTAPTSVGSGPVRSYVLKAIGRDGRGRVRDTVSATAGAAAHSRSLTLDGSLSYRFKVAAVNVAGQGAFSGLSNAVVPR